MPEPALVKRGFNPPFKSWLRPLTFDDDLTNDDKEKIKKIISPGEKLEDKQFMTGFDESIQAVVNAIRT